MRLTGPQDREALLAFLQAYETQSMFAMINLLGLGAPMPVWVPEARAGEGCVSGMVGVTEGGTVLLQRPGGDWPVVAGVLSGVAVDRVLGPADQVTALQGVLSLGAARHASEKPGYRLTLAELRLPDCTGMDLRPVMSDVEKTVLRWRMAYAQELFALPLHEARKKDTLDVARWQAADSHRVLWHNGAAVALTGFNAVLPHMVQNGAVYVSPRLRGRGCARRAVGLHLVQARAAGIRRAVLFAASQTAERAYRSLGFVADGRMGLMLFDGQRVIV
jgi:GNAT superfamily N-acetyltransferase